MRAAVPVAYGLSLRPGEYLTQAEDTPLEKQMNASDCFFVFDDEECVNICDPHLYPTGRSPSVFLCIFRKLENYKRSGVRVRWVLVQGQLLKGSAVYSHFLNTLSATRASVRR